MLGNLDRSGCCVCVCCQMSRSSKPVTGDCVDRLNGLRCKRIFTLFTHGKLCYLHNRLRQIVRLFVCVCVRVCACSCVCVCVGGCVGVGVGVLELLPLFTLLFRPNPLITIIGYYLNLQYWVAMEIKKVK